MGRLSIQEAKLRLANLLLDKSNLTPTETNILYELMKDNDIQSVLDESNKKYAMQMATNGGVA